MHRAVPDFGRLLASNRVQLIQEHSGERMRIPPRNMQHLAEGVARNEREFEDNTIPVADRAPENRINKLIDR